jgi:phosphoglycolate phosphatase
MKGIPAMHREHGESRARGGGAFRRLRYNHRMDYDALVFDLDGTLWDAAAASTYGWNVALEKLGVSTRITVEDIRSVSGTPFHLCVAGLLPELHPADDATIEFIEHHERLGIEKIGGTLYEGVAEGLRALAARYRLFLVSNCPDWYLTDFFRITGLDGCFVDSDCHGASGLDKSNMLRVLRQKHELDRALYVGDTQGDRDAAEAAGMDFAFASFGFGEATDPAFSFSSFTAVVEGFLG